MLTLELGLTTPHTCPRSSYPLQAPLYIYGALLDLERKKNPSILLGWKEVEGQTCPGTLFQQSACLLPLYLVQVGKLRQGGTIERNQEALNAGRCKE